MRGYMTTIRRPAQPDLFGQIPVTIEECLQWVLTVGPPWAGASADKAARYIMEWDIAEKVARAKARGEFDAITTGHL